MTQDHRDADFVPPLTDVPNPTPAAAPEVDEADFISLPPGMANFDSGTYRMPTRRSESTRDASAPIFVPTVVPGLPVTVAPPLVDEPAAAVQSGSEEIDDETRVISRRTSVWTLHIPDAGEQPMQQGALLVGRGPALSATWPGARLLPIDDPRKSVSKTHAAFELDASVVLRVHDLNSTNGVWLSYDNGDEVDVVPGAPGVVNDGATIHLGEFEIRATRR